MLVKLRKQSPLYAIGPCLYKRITSISVRLLTSSSGEISAFLNGFQFSVKKLLIPITPFPIFLLGLFSCLHYNYFAGLNQENKINIADNFWCCSFIQIFCFCNDMSRGTFQINNHCFHDMSFCQVLVMNSASVFFFHFFATQIATGTNCVNLFVTWFGILLAIIYISDSMLFQCLD